MLSKGEAQVQIWPNRSGTWSLRDSIDESSARGTRGRSFANESAGSADERHHPEIGCHGLPPACTTGMRQKYADNTDCSPKAEVQLDSAPVDGEECTTRCRRHQWSEAAHVEISISINTKKNHKAETNAARE